MDRIPPLFPFIARSLGSLSPVRRVCEWEIKRPSSLEGFLLPFSDFVFRKKMMFSQEDLNSKPVALYLYSDGEELPLLRQIVQECRQTDKELEVVVVSICIDGTLQSFPEIFSTVSAKRDLSWWVAPFNFSASIVLKHLFESQGDKVIIIGPNDLYVDVRGLQFMQIYGSFAYPFTFESVVQKTVEALRQVTLDSLLKLLQLQEYPSTAKKVLFYFDFPYNMISLSVHGQVSCFLKYDEVDLRFISFIIDEQWFESHTKNHKPEDCNPRDWTLQVLWHTKGAEKIHNFFERFFNHVFPTIVAFGEDGKICSLLAHDLPPSDGPEIKGNLVEEVSSILEKYLTDYDDKRYTLEGNYDHNLAYLQELRKSKF